MSLNHFPIDEIDSTELIVTSEPDRQTGTVMWRVMAKKIITVQIELQKIYNAVSEDGFASFTPPHQIETGYFRYWFQSIGVTYDVL